MSDLPPALVQSIRSAPDDDEIRQVLADWFEEQGEPERAQLVRLQLERAALPTWAADVVRLALRERALLAKHRDAWIKALPAEEGVVYGSFARGVVDTVGFETVSAVAQHAERIAQATPFSRIVLRWPRLDDRPALQPIAGLREVCMIGTVMQPEDVEWLAQSPLLETVDRLSIIASGMNAAGLGYLLASPYLKQIRVLRMPGHGFTDEGMAALMKAEWPALRELDVSIATQDELGSGGRFEPTFDDVTAIGIGAWPVLGQLTALNLTGHQIGHEGLESLIASPYMANMKRLGLKSMTDYDMDTGERPRDVFLGFDRANPDMRLDELDLGENELSSAEIATIVNQPALQALKVLRLDTMHTNLSGVFAAPWFKTSVRVLSVENPGDGDALAQILAAEPEQLHSISMDSHYGWSEVGSLDEILADAPPAPTLLHLSIRGCEIEDDVDALADRTTLPGLLSLDIADMWEEDGPEALEALRDTPFYARLVSFYARSPLDKLPPLERPSMSLGRWESFHL